MLHPPAPLAPALLPPALGHAGGFSWDEALLVLAPLAAIALLLWVANRRAGRLLESRHADDDASDEPSSDEPTPKSSPPR